MGPKTVQNPIPIIRAPIVASCSSRLTLTLNRRTRLRSDRILQKSASQVRLILRHSTRKRLGAKPRNQHIRSMPSKN